MVKWGRAVPADKTGKVYTVIRTLTESLIQTDLSNKRLSCLIKQSHRMGLALDTRIEDFKPCAKHLMSSSWSLNLASVS